MNLQFNNNLSYNANAVSGDLSHFFDFSVSSFCWIDSQIDFP